ncbi:uncharacterized protein N7506_010696 [Penicillium brevicompactum]|uniref:uncharacterized protein n=1 Tax=Penicillium brevicompactum TaxID=5074 RepID=UPI00253FF720|nr:uncharacterized protein N7506_010696 [Penicillium brevicompactum]KAJ5327594.1 hypothetical protein N7506_010696 [Penicillium brevicompactum]
MCGFGSYANSNADSQAMSNSQGDLVFQVGSDFKGYFEVWGDSDFTSGSSITTVLNLELYLGIALYFDKFRGEYSLKIAADGKGAGRP